MIVRYTTLLELEIDEWEDGYGVVQIISLESNDETELLFAYYKDNHEFGMERILKLFVLLSTYLSTVSTG